MCSINKTRSLITTILLLILKLCKQSQAAQLHHHQPQSMKSHNLLLSSNYSQITTTTPPPVEVPEFIEPIGNHTVPLGRDAQLSCKINNLGNFRTAWLRVEDKGILTIHNNIITRNYRVGLINNDDGREFILTIKNVEPSDKGQYMCQINSVPMKYAVGYLDILTPPQFEDKQPQDGAEQNTPSSLVSSTAGLVVVREGDNATLSCKASGHPEPEIVWRREDNEPIRLSNQLDEVPKVDGPTLALTSVGRLNSGAYLCIASNGVQPSASRRQMLDVQYKPVIRLPQTEVSAQLNQPEAQLFCYIDLNPLGTYHWIKLDGSLSGHQVPGSRGQPDVEGDDQALIEHEELINSDKFEIVKKQVNSETIQMVLNIRRVEKSDFAHYKCIARNSLGIQSSSIRFYESSSFSLNNMFRGSADSSSSSSTMDDLKLGDQQQNDQQDSNNREPSSRASQYWPARANTRSSWTQRSSGSTASKSHSSSSSAIGLQYSSHLFVLLMLNCLLVASIAQSSSSSSSTTIPSHTIHSTKKTISN